MAYEQWRMTGETHVHLPAQTSAPDFTAENTVTAAPANSRETANAATITAGDTTKTISQESNEQSELAKLLSHFGVRPFLRHEAQGFDQEVLYNAYTEEERSFKKTVECVPRLQIPSNANIITIHVLYKVKVIDDDTFKLKARIAPHGNKDLLKNVLTSDCCVCSPLGFRVVMTCATMMRWSIHKADVKSAFLQTGPAKRDVYVCPPRESS